MLIASIVWTILKEWIQSSCKEKRIKTVNTFHFNKIFKKTQIVVIECHKDVTFGIPNHANLGIRHYNMILGFGFK